MDLFYKSTGYAAGVAIGIIAIAILVQIIGRLTGVNLIGLVELSTYAMVAATFLGLPYTFRTAGHIRVELVIERTGGRTRGTLEAATYLLTLAFIGYFTFYTIDLALASYSRGARSQGMLSAPLWIPQGFMALGLVLFMIAIIDGLVRLLRGQAYAAQDGEVRL